MQYQRLELMTTDLVVTLDEIKEHVVVAHDDDDMLLSRYVLAAIGFAESHCEMTLRLRRVKAYAPAWPIRGTILRYGPVRQIEAVDYFNTGGEITSLVPEQWQTMPHNGLDHRLHFLMTAPTVECRRIDAVSVTYVCGYGALPGQLSSLSGFPYTLPIVFGANGSEDDVLNRLPDTIKHAIYMLVGHWYENRETEIVGTSSSPVGMAAKALLDQHRVMGA